MVVITTFTTMIVVVVHQDRADLDFALAVPGGVDVVALSFVQTAGDVQELKDVVQGRCRVSRCCVCPLPSCELSSVPAYTHGTKILIIAL